MSQPSLRYQLLFPTAVLALITISCTWSAMLLRMPPTPKIMCKEDTVMQQNDTVLLSVQDLNFKFTLRGQTLHAIRGISLDVYKGESLAIVGESGSGKSVLVKTLMGLNDQNGYIESGKILYNGQDLATFTSDKQWQAIRGREFAMVLQDPMTSLNPLKTIGWQIKETLELHQGLRGLLRMPPSANCWRKWASQNPSAVPSSTPMNSPAVCASVWSSPSPWPAGPKF